MTARADPESWAARFKQTRKAAGYTSAKKLAEKLGASSRQVIRWETEEGLPSTLYRAALRKISREMAELVAEIPEEEERRLDLARRVGEIERHVADLAAAVQRLEDQLADPSDESGQRSATSGDQADHSS